MQALQTLLPSLLPQQPAADQSPSTTSVIVTAPSASDTASIRQARALRFRELLNNIAMARGITLTTEEEDWFIERLHRDGWTSDNARNAELVCLREDWRFRGVRPRLEYSDMWPDADRVAKVATAEDLVVVTRGEIGRLRRLANEGRASMYALTQKNATADADGGENAKLNALIVQLNAERMDLHVKVEDLEREIEVLRRENDRQQRMLARMMEPDGGEDE